MKFKKQSSKRNKFQTNKSKYVKQLQMNYLQHSKIIDIYLDKDIQIISNFAVEFVREKEGFNDKNEFIRLLYRGKIMKNSLKLGNYVSGDSLIQIFKFRNED